MPTEVRGYFPTVKPPYDTEMKNLLVDKAYDIRTKWQSTTGSSPIFFPVSVVNTVHKMNPSSKENRELQIRAVWKVGSLEPKSITLEKLNATYESNQFTPLKEELKNAFVSQHSNEKR